MMSTQLVCWRVRKTGSSLCHVTNYNKFNVLKYKHLLSHNFCELGALEMLSGSSVRVQ